MTIADNPPNAPALHDPCGCLTQIASALKAAHGGEAQLQLVPYIEWRDGSQQLWLPPLRYQAKEGRRWVHGHVPFAYCPFCGTKR